MKIQVEKKRTYLPPATMFYQAEPMSMLAVSDPENLRMDDSTFIDDEEEII